MAHHRGLHFLAFGGAALLLLLLSRSRRQEIRLVVAVCLLGLSLEYLQHLLYRNVMEWWDVRDDTLSVMTAFAVYYLCRACTTAFKAPRSAPESRQKGD